MPNEASFVNGSKNGEQAGRSALACCLLSSWSWQDLRGSRGRSGHGLERHRAQCLGRPQRRSHRRAATHGATHRSLFHDPNEPAQRTLILLDEVDHLSGGLRAVSDARVRGQLMNEDDEPEGRFRGKAELLRFLEKTSQPVVLACNDVMRLWGSGSSWRSTRDRFLAMMTLNFDRVSNDAIRRIARRVPGRGRHLRRALDLLVKHNQVIFAHWCGTFRCCVKGLTGCSPQRWSWAESRAEGGI